MAGFNANTLMERREKEKGRREIKSFPDSPSESPRVV